MTSRPRRPLVSAAAVLLAAAAACQSASPSPSSSPTPAAGQASSAASSGRPADANLEASDALRAAVEADAIQDHLEELAAIAEASGGIRASGTAGYDASQSYVADTLSAAGYTVTFDEFTFPFFTETAEPMVTVVGGPSFGGGDHLRALIFSRSGDLQAPIVTVALDDDGRPVRSGGCERSDWDAFPAGAIALAGPGPCFRRQVVEHAQDASAAALMFTSPDWEPGELRRPTLIDPDGVAIPVVNASNDTGAALRATAAAGGSVHLMVQTLIQDRITANVIAERAGADEAETGDEIVMMGGHLDSVIDGPGINDNGSGTMTILEIARQLATLEPTPRTVRFAFWASEELGLFGSYHWVFSQEPEDLDNVIAYLNLDMVGSSNYVRQVYDASSAVVASRDITDAFGAYFDAVGLTWEAEDLGGASDHAPFEDSMIPTGGLFSGASEEKTDAQAELFGGTADEPMDRCYHLACDRADRVNGIALDEMSDAAAHVLMLLLLGEL